MANQTRNTMNTITRCYLFIFVFFAPWCKLRWSCNSNGTSRQRQEQQQRQQTQQHPPSSQQQDQPKSARNLPSNTNANSNANASSPSSPAATSIMAEAFKYRISGQHLVAPEMLCFSGDVPPTDPSSKLACPTTADEARRYNAVVMDEKGYVQVRLTDVRMTDDRRRGTRRRYLMDSSWSSISPASYLEEERHGWNEGTYRRDLGFKKDRSTKSSSSGKQSSATKYQPVDAHYLQVYLISLEEYSKGSLGSKCCYELESNHLHPASSSSSVASSTSTHASSLPPECRDSEPPNSSFDFRVNSTRSGEAAKVSDPVELNDSEDDHRVDLVARLTPSKRGPHLVVISNCAVEVSRNRLTNETVMRPLRAVIGEVEVRFVSKFGELPINLMGIIPFYGILSACYGLVSTVWVIRSRRLWGWRHVSSSSARYFRGNGGVGGGAAALQGLQRAIRDLVFAQTVFCSMAFFYYLHLNGTAVDVDVLYSGTAAALINWGPWSIIVALVHFGTILACQIVVTLATDGTWLIQHNVRPQTKRALFALCVMWLLFFSLYGVLTVRQRRRFFALCAMMWIGFLFLNVQRSLRHLRTLMIGQSTDRIVAVGGALVAKRSLYRKMCVIVGLYPAVFLLSFIWTSYLRQDSWAWVGYVLVDVYLFVILLHVTILCLPRRMASQEYVKYAPLEVATSDKDLWEGDVDGESWDEIEFSDNSMDSKEGNAR